MATSSGREESTGARTDKGENPTSKAKGKGGEETVPPTGAPSPRSSSASSTTSSSSSSSPSDTSSSSMGTGGGDARPRKPHAVNAVNQPSSAKKVPIPMGRRHGSKDGEGGKSREKEEEEEEEEEEEGEDEDESSFDFGALKGKSCRVHDILIKGNVRTKEYVIEREMEGARGARTLQELAEELAKASQKLNDLGIFEEVSIVCDEGPRELPGTTANLIVHVKEKGPVALHVGSYMQGREGSIEGSLQLTNYVGAAERVECNVAFGQSTSNTYSIGLNLPHFHGLPAWLRTKLFQSVRNWQRHSSHTEKLRGLSLSVASGNHDVAYELTWRDLTDSTKMASSKIRRQLGHSLLSAVKYTYALERRDDALHPTKGYAFRSSSQVAGLGSSDARLVRFFRQDLEAHYSVPLKAIGGALSFGVHGGLILPWGKDFMRRTTPISDRFFLGGASSLRGFRTKGVGPFDERRREQGGQDSSEGTGSSRRDALGGDLMLAAVTSLSFALPVKVLQALGLHGHVFLNAGNIVSITDGDSLPHPKALLSSFRVSSGAGLVWPTKLGRLELNYCYVLRRQPEDHIKRGIQFGMHASAP